MRGAIIAVSLVIILVCIAILPAYANGKLNTTRTGNFSVTRGYVNGKHVRYQTTHMGNYSTSRGAIGGKTYRATTTTMGNFSTTRVK